MGLLSRPPSAPVTILGGFPSWLQHVLSVQQFSREDLDNVIFPTAEKMESTVKFSGKSGFLSGKVLTVLFFEPSTRTSSSFVHAIERLGGSSCVINEVKFSSAAKGETLEDTILTMERYSDAIVLRHPEIGSVRRAASVAHKPIINAGDGAGEHPTQALLDLYTIREKLGRIDGQTVTMVGDLKHGRTVHSLARLLTLYHDVKINFVSPDILRMPPEFISQLRGQGVTPVEYDRLDEVIAETNVLYVTRIQKERFENLADYEAVKGSYVVDPKLLATAKPAGQMIVMHPLPRVGEITTEVDSDPRAAYFDQVEYGMYVRMALLALILRGN